MLVYILKFNKVSEADPHFWSLVEECAELDKDYQEALYRYQGDPNPDDTFIVECQGMNSEDNPKSQGYRRGMWFKDKLSNLGLDCPYFQIFKKRKMKVE